MQRSRFVLGLVHSALFSTSRIGSAEPQPHVVFLNPGEPVERGTGPYWRRENVSRFGEVALKRTEALDFRVYSKAFNPGPGPYDFRLARLVEPENV